MSNMSPNPPSGAVPPPPQAPQQYTPQQYSAPPPRSRSGLWIGLAAVIALLVGLGVGVAVAQPSKNDVASQRAGNAVPKRRSRQTMAAVASWPYLRPLGMLAMMPPPCDDAAGPLRRSRHEQQVSVLKPSLASQVPTTSASSSSNVRGDTNPFDEARTESSFSVVSAMDSHTPPHLPRHQRSHPTTRTLTSTHAPWLLLDPTGLPVGRWARQRLRWLGEHGRGRRAVGADGRQSGDGRTQRYLRPKAMANAAAAPRAGGGGHNTSGAVVHGRAV
jgi:hypothetical protein